MELKHRKARFILNGTFMVLVINWRRKVVVNGTEIFILLEDYFFADIDQGLGSLASNYMRHP